MKKFALIMGLVLAAAASFVSCDKNGGEDYAGTNYIYLSADGKTTIYAGLDDEKIVVDVMLTAALDEDLTLDFVVGGGSEDLVSLEGNPVTIAAGSKSGQFSIVPASSDVSESRSLSVSLSAGTVLPEKVALKEAFSFTVAPVSAEALTEEQQAIIEAYRTKTGIDISGYIGVVNVSVQYTGTDQDSGEPLDVETISGKTVITLGEDATAGTPVLKMLSNPMGIQDKMYAVLRSVTIDNDEYWFDEDYSLPCYKTLVDAIGWTKTSAETFSMSLDGIKVNEDGTVDFLGEGYSQYEDEITIVPFIYSFSAYDRELAAIEAGTLSPEDDPDWAYDATANPAYHLNCDDISEDLYEAGNWIEPSAEITNESLVFTFCVYACAMDSDYTRVVATYTPNK